MANRDCFPRRGCSFKVVADRVIEAEPAFLDEQHDSCGDELLTNRGIAVIGSMYGLQLELTIRKAIALGLNDLPFFDGGEEEARVVLPPHLGLQVVVCLVRLGNGRYG